MDIAEQGDTNMKCKHPLAIEPIEDKSGDSCMIKLEIGIRSFDDLMFGTDEDIVIDIGPPRETGVHDSRKKGLNHIIMNTSDKCCVKVQRCNYGDNKNAESGSQHERNLILSKLCTESPELNHQIGTPRKGESHHTA